MAKKYVYLKLDAKIWETWYNAYKNDKEFHVPFKELLIGEINYKNANENKSDAAISASKTKKANKDLFIYMALERKFNSLLKTDTDININKLANESGVSYQTVKRFWNEYSLDKWIKEFQTNPESLKRFLYQELAESLVYASKDVLKRIK